MSKLSNQLLEQSQDIMESMKGSLGKEKKSFMIANCISRSSFDAGELIDKGGFGSVHYVSLNNGPWD